MSQLIGTGQNQVPVNGLLGTMAFQNKEAINVNTVSSPLATPLTLQSAGVTAVTISSAQNVGIGTASPGAKLDVQGTSIDGRVYSTNSGGKARMFVRGDTANMSYESDGTAQTSILFDNVAGQVAYAYALGASGYWRFYTNGTERMRINSSGNLGVGVTPSAWGSNYKAIQLPGGAIDSYTSNSISVICNAYDSGAGAWTYVTSSFATRYDQNASGQHVWWNAATGTAGAAITFVNSMTLSATSNLTVAGTISPQQATTAAAPAYVKGAMYFDTTLNKLRIGGATAWETVTSV